MRIDLDFHERLKESFATKLVSAIILKDIYSAAPLDNNKTKYCPQVLLGLRKNTEHFSDHWSLPIGHVELGESDRQAIKRELQEELAIQALDIVELFVKTNLEKSIYHQVFWVKQWQGDVKNAEPHLCQQIKWFDNDHLPTPITSITAEIIADFRRSKSFKQLSKIEFSN